MLRTRKAMQELEAQDGARGLLGERGSIATQAALVLPVMLGFTALAVDGAYLYVEEAHIQTVTDATALAVAGAFQTGDYTDVELLRAETVAENKKTNGTAYEASGFVVKLGTWSDGGGFTEDTSVVDQGTFSTLVNSGDMAVEVVATGQTAPLFFGALILGTSTTPFSGRSVVAYRNVGVGPPTNCGVLSNSSLILGGSVNVDGYSSDDCAPGGVGYTDVDPVDGLNDNPDLDMGVCSNGDSTLGGSGNLYGNIAYGPGGDDTISYNGNAALPPSRLAQDVAMPTIATCAEGGADDLASDLFWSDYTLWSKCIDTDLDGEANNAVMTEKDAKAVAVVTKDGASKDYNIKINDNSAGIALSADCGAPQKMCIHDLTTVASGTIFFDQASYSNDDPYALMASGDVKLTGQGAVNVNDSKDADGTGGAKNEWVSNGDNAGDLQLFVQGNVDMEGGSEFSGIVFAQGTITYLGNSDQYGDFFALGQVKMSGSSTAHLDRCYEINDGNNNTDTFAYRLVLVE